MASLQASSFLHSSAYSLPRLSRKRTITSILDLPKTRASNIPLHDLQTGRLAEELEKARSYTSLKTTFVDKKFTKNDENYGSDSMVLEKLYAILEAVADRVEMHKNIGDQRDNWNSLLLTSINAITLAGATMSGIASTIAAGAAPVGALKICSTLMFIAATGMLCIMNKIQPSQLAEEQRNAARLFKQLQKEIETTIAIGEPTDRDVNEAMQKVLALDKAYPLPLLGVMLEKFPSNIEPAVWWPQQQRSGQVTSAHCNGWNAKLEKEMRSIVEVLRRKDKEEYLRLGGKALKLNKMLAVSGPLLTALAAIGSSFVGSPMPGGSWAAILGVVAGSLASVVNTLEHGAQVGMQFEMYRGNAGFFKLMEESIESNLIDNRRENGELFEMKVALQLGRSLSELRDIASSSSNRGGEVDEFASKLF
ncbi:hypothetical protein ACH5RR_014797 [Cinchona calisaya]|uniref:F-box protein n=1 Tax=Cinchona calisaya TaxID=153742 RepID=A0ABD2ZSH7_9GENT